MTLRKKGLLPPDAWKWLYFLMLASVRYSLVRYSLVRYSLVSAAIVSMAIVSIAYFAVGRGCPRLGVALDLRVYRSAEPRPGYFESRHRLVSP